MRTTSFSITGMVLKRTNVGESDKILSLLTQEMGKITCVAKGVRKITSSKRAFLEPANVVKVFLVETKSLPLLTQAALISKTAPTPTSLSAFRQLSQLLEFCDRVFVSEAIEPHTYAKVIALRDALMHRAGSAVEIRTVLRSIIVELGFQDPEESNYDTIADYVAALTDHKMRSFEYLSVRSETA